MSDKICYIIGAAKANRIDFSPEKEDLVIAADGGYLTAIRSGIKPNIIIGDFDSSPLPENLRNMEIIKLKPEKDYTDTAEAIKVARQRGFDNFIIYGGLGGDRISHTVANLALISGLSRENIKATLIGEKTKIYAVTDNTVCTRNDCRYFSVFSFGGNALVSIEGAKYPLSRYELSPYVPLGVSNETASRAKITVHSGTLIVVEEFL